jgi:hypothetical protein
VSDESKPPCDGRIDIPQGDDSIGKGTAHTGANPWLRSQLAWFSAPRHVLPFAVSKGMPLFAVLFLGFHGGDVLLLYLFEGIVASVVFAGIWPRGGPEVDAENGATPAAMLVFLAFFGGIIVLVLHNEYDYAWVDAAERLAVPAAIVGASVIFTGLSLAFPWAGRTKRVRREFGVVGRMTFTLMLLLIFAPFSTGLNPVGTAVLLIMIDSGLTVLTAQPGTE